MIRSNLRKQTTFCDTSACFPVKREFEKLPQKTMLMMHEAYLGSASDWMKQANQKHYPELGVVTRHQNGISLVVS